MGLYWLDKEKIMRTYLVTGGAGFIGSNYIQYILKKYGEDIHIINLDKLTYAGNPENLSSIKYNKNYTFIKGDICNKEIVDGIFRDYDIDRVVHFAAESHVDRSIKEPEIFVKTNVLGTAVLLMLLKRHGRMQTALIRKIKSFCIYRQMKYMVALERRTIFMKKLRMIHIVHILPVKHLRICW